jgi:hypothetical protein
MFILNDVIWGNTRFFLQLIFNGGTRKHLRGYVKFKDVYIIS